MPVLDGSTWCYTFFPKTHAVHRLPNELKSRIVHFCDMPTLVGLLHDTDWQGFVEIELTLSLLKVLAKITDRPTSFREMMRLTQSIITGSTALHYILRQPSQWQPSDTDLVVPVHHFQTAMTFITELSGAHVIFDSADDAVAPYPTLNKGYTRLVQVQTFHGTIDVMQSSSRSPFGPLPSYWGTHVMNALTSDTFICPYPKLTYHHQALVQYRRNHPNIRSLERKYQARGFAIFTSTRDLADLSVSCHHFSACPRRDRYFGDEETLTVPIRDVTYNPADWAEPDAEFTTAWRLGGRACGNRWCFLHCSAASSTVRLLRPDGYLAEGSNTTAVLA